MNDKDWLRHQLKGRKGEHKGCVMSLLQLSTVVLFSGLGVIVLGA